LFVVIPDFSVLPYAKIIVLKNILDERAKETKKAA
jgi:hypothetical protein